MDSIVNAKAEDFLLKEWTADCVIMDPPDNIGLSYNGYYDHREDYYYWLSRLILGTAARAEVVWLSYNAIHDIEIKRMIRVEGWKMRTFIWSFSFGQNRETDCGSGYRPILRLSAPGVVWDTESIKVPSEREKIGDKRAKAGGRVPLDVWDFPRVVGNSTERCSWHPTQHPEALYIRMMALSGCRRPGSWKVVDLFAGTGTIFRAARQLRTKNPKIQAVGVEISKSYCDHMGSGITNPTNPSTALDER